MPIPEYLMNDVAPPILRATSSFSTRVKEFENCLDNFDVYMVGKGVYGCQMGQYGVYMGVESTVLCNIFSN